MNYGVWLEYFYAFGAFELVVSILELPVSVANLCLIGRTPLIHANMKAILLYQSACILMRVLGRFPICSLKFVLQDPIAPEMMEPYRSIYMLAFYNRNFVVHVLILERVLATLRFSTYEHKTVRYFTLCWMPIVFCASLYNLFGMDGNFSSLTAVAIESALLLVGFVEMAVFVRLNSTNRLKYLGTWTTKKAHSLSEKYQLSENIRIGRQLMPTLVLHLWMLFGTTVSLFSAQFTAPTTYLYVLGFSSANSCFCGLLIEVTMITCHPFLKRDLEAMLSRVCGAFRSARVEQAQQQHRSNASAPTAQIAMQAILNGEAIRAKGTQDEHFAQLRTAWQ